jgi:hypothetical protein
MLGSPFCVEDQNGNGLIVNVIGRWGYTPLVLRKSAQVAKVQ